MVVLNSFINQLLSPNHSVIYSVKTLLNTQSKEQVRSPRGVKDEICSVFPRQLISWGKL